MQRSHAQTHVVFFVAAAWGLVGAFGCGPVSGDVPVEVVVFDDDDDIDVLGVEVIPDVVNILRGEGSRFDVVGVPKVGALELQTLVSEESLYPGYDDVVEGQRELAGGDVVNPRLSWNGSEWQAQDYDSLAYLTAFANFEKVWSFMSEYDNTGATDEHAIVGFYGEVVVSNLITMPVIAADNAAYVSTLDGWLVLRSVALSGEALPLGMNDAVIAHEFAHRYVHHNLHLRTDENFDLWRSATVNGFASSTDAFNLRGIDEGIADVFALAYSGKPDFIERSITSATPAISARDVEGEFADLVTYEHFLNGGYPDNDFQDACNGDLSSEGFNFYCIGTLFARVMWDTAGGDANALRTEVLPVLEPALADASERIQRNGANGLLFRPSFVLEPLAQRLPANRQQAFCDGVIRKFGTFVILGEVPSCL